MARSAPSRKTARPARTAAALSRSTPEVSTDGARVATVEAAIAGAVRLEDGTLATVAVAGYSPSAGDRVVVVRGTEAFVVGIIAAASPPAISTRDGVRADVEASMLRVRDPSGRVLFEHDAERGCSVVHAPAGDLELRADHGNVRIVSGASVSIDADRTVDLRGARGVSMTNRAGANDAGSTIAIDAQGLRAASPRLDVTAEAADVRLIEGRMTARVIESTVGVVRQLAEIVETRATRVLTRAKDVYARIEGLAQTHAGRVRMVADDAVHVSGAQALIKGRDDVKIRGAKIHLG